MKELKIPDESYLGDGLYVSFDGFMFTLRAPREDGDHWVALEPNVYHAFIGYVAEKTKRETVEPL